ncbi:MAG TPA: hypothetical protein DCS93_19060 [Microscillaceae bacterium]|nr:hypothetical protein [Microscillaceae bacterium]
MQTQTKNLENPTFVSLPPLLIDEEFKFILIKKSGRVEVKMNSLCKILYLLFVQHPEGISLYNLPDYEEDLKNLYLPICWEYHNKHQFIQQSIASLTCRYQNSIHEKISRIRAIFNKHLSPDIAPLYHIDGERSQAKKIALSRELIIVKYKAS